MENRKSKGKRQERQGAFGAQALTVTDAKLEERRGLTANGAKVNVK